MTRDTAQPLRILCIYAHHDDAEFSIAGSVARWAGEGAEIAYCIVTDGAAGSNEPGADLEQLVRTRRDEQLAAARVLGVKEVFFLGYQDGTLQPTLELRRDLTRLIRQFRPDRVVCGDPTAVFYGNGYINHPDHRAAAEAALYATFPSAETRPIFPELLVEGFEPHKVKEVYISGSMQPDTFVDISNTLDYKIEALRCHKSQVDPGDGQWVRDWAAEIGKAGGLPYAESFRVMRLVQEPEAPAE